MQKDSRIYIAGHRGLVGSAIFQCLKKRHYTNIITRTHKELDLVDTSAVEKFFENEKPEYVFMAAAKVGGIWANNTYRADFMYQNLMIQNNIIHQSYLHKVKKLLFLGSTCIYPKDSPQPMKETNLLTGILEYTNEPYAVAKIAGIKMCESYNLQYGTNFISVMPTNLYGPNDNFDLETSHVLPALIRKIHLGKALDTNNWDAIRNDLHQNPIKGVDENSKENKILKALENFGIHFNEVKNVMVEVWGSGKPMREFLWSGDMADACIFLMENITYSDLVDQILDQGSKGEIRNTHINIGTGKDISIKDLAYLIKEKVGYEGDLFFNSEKADGTMKKVTDINKLRKLGWKHNIELEAGIEIMYENYVSPQFSSFAS